MLTKRSFLTLTASTLVAAVAAPALAQSRRYDIDVSDLPAPVKKVLERYIAILRTSKTLDQCAKRFIAVAGGSLVNEDGKTLRGNVKPYSLKKDHSNIKFYASPIEITRVAKLRPSTSGFGPSAIRGDKYKIWIAKKDDEGRPAPVTIMVPKNHKTIKTPKVITIGSF